MSNKKQAQQATPSDLAIARDWALDHGEIEAAATEGERILIFTPTCIYAGLVARVGPLVIELIDAGIVYETGDLIDAANGTIKDLQSWPGAIRIPIGAILSAAVQVQTNADDDILAARKWTLEHGEIQGAANEGERALIFTPTFIYAGLVSRVGPTVIELIDAGIVYETGDLTVAASGKLTDFQTWPGPIRIPTGAILSVAIVEFPESVETWSSET
jgi:hypothetical protein